MNVAQRVERENTAHTRLRRERRGERLVKATLRCRLCSRPVGDLIGRAGAPITAARFAAIPGSSLPRVARGQIRCGRCGGQLHLDEIDELGRTVPLSEAGALTFADVLRGSRGGVAA
jgi:hypothetical protein